MPKTNTYWRDCVDEAFENAGITASSEQRDIVAEWFESGHENYGMAHGHECIPNPLQEENKMLRKDLERERSKVMCSLCKGIGWLRSNWGVRVTESQCWKCRGEGRVTR